METALLEVISPAELEVCPNDEAVVAVAAVAVSVVAVAVAVAASASATPEFSAA